MKIRRVLVCGYYGFANTGDEAILQLLVQDLRAVYAGAEIVVLAGSPEGVRDDFGVESFHWQDALRLADEARRADLMVLGGGGLFQDHHGFEPEQVLTSRHCVIGYYAGFAILAGMTSTPLVIYGVGVGPLATEKGRLYTRVAVGRASAVTVRDASSRTLLEAIGVDTIRVRVTADPVWCLEPASPEIADQLLQLQGVERTGRGTIGVAVRPWVPGTWVGELAEALDGLVARLDARVLFLPFQDSPNLQESDYLAALEVARRMRRTDRWTILRGAYQPAERMAILGSCHLVIGMRLHSVIFAGNALVPVVALCYDPKVRAAMEQLGLDGQALELGTLSADAILAAASRASAPNHAVVSGLRARAGANRAALVEVPAPPPADDEVIGVYLDLAVTRFNRAQALCQSHISTLLEAHRVLEAEHRTLREAERALREEHRHLVGRHGALELEHQALRDAHERVMVELTALRERYQAVLNSRAVRLAGRLWRLHAAVQSGVRGVSNKVYARAESKCSPAVVQPDVEGEPDATCGTCVPALDLETQSASMGMDRDPSLHSGDPGVRREIQAQISSVLAEHADVPGIVYYPPTIGWNVTLFQRPQQMALAFARLGYLVFYGIHADSPESEAGLQCVSPRVYLTKLPTTMTDLLGALPEPIAISYVYNFGDTKRLRNPAVIFEHIDELEVFEATHNRASLRSWYEEAIAGAKLVVASAQTLLDETRLRRPDAVLCPNGVDYQFFSQCGVRTPPEDIAHLIGRPIIGYYGAIADWLDFTLIRKAATELPEFEFVFIGPRYSDAVATQLAVFDLPNTHWVGPKEHQELPAYLHTFDVATIPFVINDITHGVSPLKLFEYMAGGRPVVTPRLQECARYAAVLVAEDGDDYVAKLRQALRLRDDPQHAALCSRTARANTWDVRVGTLVEALAKARRK